MSRIRLAAFAVAPLLLSVAPAHALPSDFRVELSHSDITGYPTATVLCSARAVTGEPGFTASNTWVECSIDDQPRGAFGPGDRAYAVNASEVGFSYLVCVSGGATFSNGNVVVDIASYNQCTAYDHFLG